MIQSTSKKKRKTKKKRKRTATNPSSGTTTDITAIVTSVRNNYFGLEHITTSDSPFSTIKPNETDSPN